MRDQRKFPPPARTGVARCRIRLPELLALVMTAALWTFTTTVTLPSLQQVSHENPALGFTFFLILCISSLSLAREVSRQAFGFHIIHWLFVYMFFYCAAVTQFARGELLWGLTPSTRVDFVQVNIVILVWSVVWLLGASIPSRKQAEALWPGRPRDPRRVPPPVLLVLFLACLSLLVTKYQREGLESFFFRGADDATFQAGSSVTGALVLTTLEHALPLVLAFAVLWNHAASPRGRIYSPTLLAGLLLCLVMNFPLAVSRYWLAAVAIVLAQRLGMFRHRGVLSGVILFGILYIFPLVNIGRRVTATNQLSQQDISLARADFHSGDYDAYSMMAWIHLHTSSENIVYGKNVLSAIFFFFPRTFWPGKLVGTGRLVSDAQGLTYDNVSAPLPGEMQFAFGWIGIIFGGLLLSAWLRHLDRGLGRNTQRAGFATTYAYGFAVGMFFFIMRGDLLSSTAYLASTIGFVCLVGASTGLYLDNRRPGPRILRGGRSSRRGAHPADG